MKFKTWLKQIEEAQLRSRTPSANTDPTTSWGAAAQYGGARALLPISPGIDNRAFAGVVDGIGIARKKVRDETGAEPGSASQYSGLEDIRRSNLQVAYMPLQYPLDYDETQILSLNRSLITKAKKAAPSGDPLGDSSIWNVDDSKSKLKPHSIKMETELYLTQQEHTDKSNKYYSAINFTTALMQASFAARLGKWSHLLNLESPKVKEQKVVPFPLNTSRRGGSVSSVYYVLMCAFEFSPKDKDTNFGSDLSDEIDAAANSNNARPPAPAPAPAPKNKRKVSRVSGGNP